jgi:hypothetical protein
MKTLLILHAASSWMMVGVIWFVQVVHYPLMSRADRVRFPEFAAAHSRRTTWIVAPPMLIEAATAAILAFRPPPGVPAFSAWFGLGLVGIIWVSTAALQVPRHRDLADGFDPRAHRRLVATNWIRTLAWTGRGILILWWLVRVA